MKKSILILALVLAFSFAFSVSSFAYDNTVTFSDDYNILYFNGKSYSRANTDVVNDDEYIEGTLYTSDFVTDTVIPLNYYGDLKIQLTDSQKSELTKVYVTVDGDSQLFASAELNYEDGKTIWYSYVRDDVKDDFDKIRNDKTWEYAISFYDYSSEEDIIKKVSSKNLMTDDFESIYYYEYMEFDVIVYSEKYDYSVYKGCIYSDDKSYYYFDFAENGINNPFDLYDIYDFCDMYGISQIKAHKITDEETIAIIEDGLQEYYDNDYGYLYNESFTEPVAKIFFSLVFAIFPLAVAVTTLVLALKSKKGLYKKLLLATSGLSLASLAVFVYIAFTLFNK